MLIRTSMALMLAAAGAAISACGQPQDSAGGDADAVVEATAAEHEGDTPSASPLADRQPASPVVTEEIAYGESADGILNGYLAIPVEGIPPFPGVIVIHERWGLNENIKAMTRQLAGEGFVALAVDLYGGELAETPEQARSLTAAVTDDPQAALDNLRQAYGYFDRNGFASSIATLGWCLGGSWSLQAGLDMPQEIDAVVMYYGQLTTDEALLDRLEAPLLGLFAENDDSIPVGEVRRFRSTLNSLGKQAEVFIYSDVGHAFANPSGGNYDAESAEDAWQRAIRFLNDSLR